MNTAVTWGQVNWMLITIAVGLKWGPGALLTVGFGLPILAAVCVYAWTLYQVRD